MYTLNSLMDIVHEVMGVYIMLDVQINFEIKSLSDLPKFKDGRKFNA